MKVGLIRHFKVDCYTPEPWCLITPEQFAQWLDQYELSDIQQPEDLPNLGIWSKCYTSNMPRAIKTAKTIFNGPIVETEALREVVMYPPIKKSIKLPMILWVYLGRFAWMLSHKSQLESKANFEKRLKYIVEEIILKDRDDVLIVSHGFLMYFLRKELLRLGFKGSNFTLAQNGVVYVFEKYE